MVGVSVRRSGLEETERVKQPYDSRYDRQDENPTDDVATDVFRPSLVEYLVVCGTVVFEDDRALVARRWDFNLACRRPGLGVVENLLDARCAQIGVGAQSIGRRFCEDLEERLELLGVSGRIRDDGNLSPVHAGIGCFAVCGEAENVFDRPPFSVAESELVRCMGIEEAYFGSVGVFQPSALLLLFVCFPNDIADVSDSVVWACENSSGAFIGRVETSIAAEVQVCWVVRCHG